VNKIALNLVEDIVGKHKSISGSKPLTNRNNVEIAIKKSGLNCLKKELPLYCKISGVSLT